MSVKWTWRSSEEDEEGGEGGIVVSEILCKRRGFNGER